MKAVLSHSSGEPGTLVIEEVPDLTSDATRVRMSASASAFMVVVAWREFSDVVDAVGVKIKSPGLGVLTNRHASLEVVHGRHAANRCHFKQSRF